MRKHTSIVEKCLESVPFPESGVGALKILALQMEQDGINASKKAQYLEGLVSDWWKPQTTSQAVHHEHAKKTLSELCSILERYR